jgi:formamidopyrimidine-DNA glycosylase
MPELPEVETVRTGLSRSWIGKRIDGVELRRAGLRFPFPDGLEERLTGLTITGIRRRAKYLLIDLDNDDILLSHLGMSGKWTLDASDCEGKHDHVVIHLDDGSMSVYNDPRRFGVLDIFRGESHKLLDHLGPEPLEEWPASDLYAKLQRRKSPIKICILDQKVVVKVILSEAIRVGGSSLRDFAGVDGTLGYFIHQFRVYDKEGADCECGGIIERLVQGGRSTFWCTSCQK